MNMQLYRLAGPNLELELLIHNNDGRHRKYAIAYYTSLDISVTAYASSTTCERISATSSRLRRRDVEIESEHILIIVILLRAVSTRIVAPVRIGTKGIAHVDQQIQKVGRIAADTENVDNGWDETPPFIILQVRPEDLPARTARSVSSSSSSSF